MRGSRGKLLYIHKSATLLLTQVWNNNVAVSFFSPIHLPFIFPNQQEIMLLKACNGRCDILICFNSKAVCLVITVGKQSKGQGPDKSFRRNRHYVWEPWKKTKNINTKQHRFRISWKWPCWFSHQCSFASGQLWWKRIINANLQFPFLQLYKR